MRALGCLQVLFVGLLTVLAASGCERNATVEPSALPPIVVESPQTEELRMMLKELSLTGLPLGESGQYLIDVMQNIEFLDEAERAEMLQQAQRMIRSQEPETIKRLAQQLLEKVNRSAK